MITGGYFQDKQTGAIYHTMCFARGIAWTSPTAPAQYTATPREGVATGRVVPVGDDGLMAT